MQQLKFGDWVSVIGMKYAKYGTIGGYRKATNEYQVLNPETGTEDWYPASAITKVDKARQEGYIKMRRLSETSIKKIDKYLNAASYDKGQANHEADEMNDDMYERERGAKRSARREIGIRRAIKQRMRKTNEEKQPLDEISQQVASKYLDKAKASMEKSKAREKAAIKRGDSAVKNFNPDKMEAADKDMRKEFKTQDKRRMGMIRAKSRLK